MMIGTYPVIVIPSKSLSVTSTIMIEITKEKSPRVSILSGRVIILRTVPSMRFTIARITPKITALIYPSCSSIPGTYPDFAIKKTTPPVMRNEKR